MQRKECFQLFQSAFHYGDNAMTFTRNQRKVFLAIVVLYAVNVVNVLPRLQGSPESTCHNESMLLNITASSGHHMQRIIVSDVYSNIPVACLASSTLPAPAGIGSTFQYSGTRAAQPACPQPIAIQGSHAVPLHPSFVPALLADNFDDMFFANRIYNDGVPVDRTRFSLLNRRLLGQHFCNPSLKPYVPMPVVTATAIPVVFHLLSLTPEHVACSIPSLTAALATYDLNIELMSISEWCRTKLIPVNGASLKLFNIGLNLSDVICKSLACLTTFPWHGTVSKGFSNCTG